MWNFRSQIESSSENVQLPFHEGNVVHVLYTQRQTGLNRVRANVGKAGEYAYFDITPLLVMISASSRPSAQPAR